MMPKPDRACALNCRGHLLCWWQTATACVRWLHPIRVFLWFCFSVWYGGKRAYPFCTICGGVFFQVFRKLTCTQTSVMSLIWMEKCPQEFTSASGTGLGDIIRVQKLLHLILVWLCPGWDCCRWHSPFQAHSLERGASEKVQLPVQLIAQI